MSDHLDTLVERAWETHTMPLAELIKEENLDTYEYGYEDILFADAINVALIPHEEYLIIVRQYDDGSDNYPAVEYAIYSQEDRDGQILLNSANMNAVYHLIRVGEGKYPNMATAIHEAVKEIEKMKEE